MDNQIVAGKTASAPAKPAETPKNVTDTKTEPKVEAKVEAKPRPLIENLEEILASSKSRTSGGVKIRANVGYTLVPEGVKRLMGGQIADQKKVVLRILGSALTVEKPIISEPELHALITEAYKAGTLKTKQDPWHIFRYYRTGLVSDKALKEVEIKVAETPKQEVETKAA